MLSTKHDNNMLFESTASNQVHALNVKWNVLYQKSYCECDGRWLANIHSTLNVLFEMGNLLLTVFIHFLTWEVRTVNIGQFFWFVCYARLTRFQIQVSNMIDLFNLWICACFLFTDWIFGCGHSARLCSRGHFIGCYCAGRKFR